MRIWLIVCEFEATRKRNEEVVSPEHNIAQFGIVNELWIDTCSVDRLQHWLFDRFYGVPTEACGKNVGQQKCGAFLLNGSESFEKFVEFSSIDWSLDGNMVTYLAVPEYVEQ